MTISKTQKDLISHLDYATREFDPNNLECFTTTAIACTLSISRNLASQYLNELVRRGLVIKAGVRPIYYFHRHSLERFLQARIVEPSYGSVGELLALHQAHVGEGFERAVGFGLSLSTAAEQMRVAMGYPPCGLPVLIMGAGGTGKTYLVELMLEHGQKTGLLNPDARILSVDCARFQRASEELERAYWGSEECPGWVNLAKGGLLLFKYVDALPPAQREFLFTHALLAARAEQGMEERGLRFVFTTSVAADSAMAREFLHRLPVVVNLPSLSERTLEERGELTLRFLKDEGRRMGVDVRISQSAFNCLVSADFDDNISELRRSVTNACAEAYLERDGSGAIEVRTYRLPANVLNKVSARQAESEGPLIDTTRITEQIAHKDLPCFLASALRVYEGMKDGAFDEADVMGELEKSVCAFERYLVSGHGARGSRLDAYARLIGEVVNDTNDTCGIKLSGATARLLAQLLYMQLWADGALPRWKTEHRSSIIGLLTLLACSDTHSARIAEDIVARTRRVLGAEPDVLTRLVTLAHIALIERLDTPVSNE